MAPKESLYLLFYQTSLLMIDGRALISRTHPVVKHCQWTRLPFTIPGTPQLHINEPSLQILSLFPELVPVNLRQLPDKLPSHQASFIARAYQLWLFNQTHQFCGRCGHTTQAHTHNIQRTCLNPACQNHCYANPAPAIMVAIKKQNKLLLAKSKQFGWYSLLAGFVDPGENLEAAIHREVYEEVGLKVHKIRYIKSQAWAPSCSLLMGFEAEYLSGDIDCDNDEIESAAFFSANNMPTPCVSNPHSLAKQLIDRFVFKKESESNG